MLRGSLTALATPFENNCVDEAVFTALIEHQIASGTQAIVVAGTTGEAPTLSVEERLRIIETAVCVSAGRVPIIAGTGTNSTDMSVQNQKHAKTIGVDVGLVVTPYYNKPSQNGILAHYHLKFRPNLAILPLYVGFEI